MILKLYGHFKIALGDSLWHELTTWSAMGELSVTSNTVAPVQVLRSVWWASMVSLHSSLKNGLRLTWNSNYAFSKQCSTEKVQQDNQSLDLDETNEGLGSWWTLITFLPLTIQWSNTWDSARRVSATISVPLPQRKGHRNWNLRHISRLGQLRWFSTGLIWFRIRLNIATFTSIILFVGCAVWCGAGIWSVPGLGAVVEPLLWDWTLCWVRSCIETRRIQDSLGEYVHCHLQDLC